MKVLRGLLGGVVFGIIGELSGWLIYGAVFAKWTEQASHVWRPMESSYWRVWVPLADILGGLMFALAYAILYKGIPGSRLIKGPSFGLIIWLITRFAGELFFYAMSPIPFMLVVAGWVQGLIVALLGGLAVAAIYGRSLETR